MYPIGRVFLPRRLFEIPRGLSSRGPGGELERARGDLYEAQLERARGDLYEAQLERARGDLYEAQLGERGGGLRPPQ